MSAALDLLGGLVLEDGRRWGDVAEPWQWQDARAVLEPGDDGARLHFLTRPRSGSKTSDLAGMVAAAMLEQLPASARCYAIAVDRDQARLLVDALAGFVGRTPGLAGALKVDRYQAVTPSGVMLEVLASDAPSAYGLRGHLFVVDELTQWPVESRAMWTALVSAVPKVKGARLALLGSAGDPAHWSYKVRQRAGSSPRWRLHEVPGPVPWVDLGDLEEQRALLTDSQFERLHLNRWSASEDRLVDVEGVRAAVVLDGPQEYRPGVVYRVGCDVGLRHDRTAIAVCHAEQVEGGRRRVVLDRLVVFAGSRAEEVSLADVEAALVQVWRSYGRPKVRLDPWQAVGLAQRLRQRGVTVEEWSYTAQRYGAAASALFALLRDGLLALYPHEELEAELLNVRLRETLPGQVRVDHDPDGHDDMVQALGFAVTALLERGAPAPARLSSVTDRRLPATPIRRASGMDTSYAGGGIQPKRPLLASRQQQILRKQGFRVVPPGAFRPPREGPQP